MFGGAAPDGSYMNDLHMLDVDFSYYSTAAAAEANDKEDSALRKRQQQDEQKNQVVEQNHQEAVGGGANDQTDIDNGTTISIQSGTATFSGTPSAISESDNKPDKQTIIGSSNSSAPISKSVSSSSVPAGRGNPNNGGGASVYLRRAPLPIASPPPVAALRRRYSWAARVSTTEMLAAAIDSHRPFQQLKKVPRLKELGEDGEEEEEEDHDNGQLEEKSIVSLSDLETRNAEAQAVVDSVLSSMRSFEVSMPYTNSEHQGGRAAANLLLKEIETWVEKLKNVL
jgi:hypothetical protein